MPIHEPEYVFKRTRLENGQTEIRIVMPPTEDPEVELRGADARKETSRWLLSIASGLATACGIEIQETFYIIHAAVADNVDQETILRTIREKRCTPESLAADPPGDIDQEILRILLADLMDSGVVYLDGHLKCTGDN
jgi:hypothetical protein